MIEQLPKLEDFHQNETQNNPKWVVAEVFQLQKFSEMIFRVIPKTYIICKNKYKKILCEKIEPFSRNRVTE